METFENASHAFIERLSTTMAFKLAIGAFLTAADKRHCLKTDQQGRDRFAGAM